MDLLIFVARILPGDAGQRIDDGAVLVSDGRIVAAGHRDEVEPLAPPSAERVSFPTGTALPGLIDCHVHLAFDAGPDIAAAVAGENTALVLGMAARAQRLLDAGVTTVRDLGDRAGLAVRVRDAIAAGHLAGPRILAATVPLTIPGGHCWFLGGEVDGERSIRDAVRRNADAGADVIKIMVTGGHLTPTGPGMWDSQFGADEVRVAVEEAGRFGLPVAAHAHGTDGIAAAVAAGVTTIEHCTWLRDGGFDAPEDLVARIVDAGIYVCPAISRNWRGFAKRFGEDNAAELFDRLRWMDERGVRLAAGTDTGVPGAVFADPVGALEVFAHVGFAPERIIELATVDAAAALGLPDTGRLVPGNRADVLVVDGDPVAGLAALRDVRLVLAGGRPHVPTTAALRST
ncbi:amidohydrolase family protein [Gandjariella thermophila]|uniref:Amidohydrolase n=1 Tax=Gandjariella thermophila TaxID=1931992 RepID=A0A4D4J5V6_9PSEU|nr:amidohydrolase family protein [Gandjariella thermophila]GDY30482.1 amidohydrolase [Gandjariella thermophila]